MSLRKWMNLGGPAGSSGGQQPSEDVGGWNSASSERVFGMENFGNTCYANSVLQALYSCEPFRQQLESCSLTPPTPHRADVNKTSPPIAFSRYERDGHPILNQIPTSPRRPSSRPTSRSGLSAGKSGIAQVFGHRRMPSGVDAHDSHNDSAGPSTNGSPAPGAPSHLPNHLPQPDGKASQPTEELPGPAASLFSTLKELFLAISSSQKQSGVISPHAFITQLKRENELFRSTMHQDAHEFLIYLMNAVAEEVSKVEQEKHKAEQAHQKTWVHNLFEGTLTNETRCLTCETVTNRDESFLDLSIDIEQNTSVTACLRQFSASEMLCQRNKFSCDRCCGLQEAEKRMKIKRLPNLLALHLKRFKYQEDLQRYTKLNYRVAFPFELRLFNTADNAKNPDRLYSLWAIVVHIGVGPHHGHYVTAVKSQDRWRLFDDHEVRTIDESDIQKYFGDTPGMGSGYVLFYQAVDVAFSPPPRMPHLPHPQPPLPVAREQAQTSLPTRLDESAPALSANTQTLPPDASTQPSPQTIPTQAVSASVVAEEPPARIHGDERKEPSPSEETPTNYTVTDATVSPSLPSSNGQGLDIRKEGNAEEPAPSRPNRGGFLRRKGKEPPTTPAESATVQSTGANDPSSQPKPKGLKRFGWRDRKRPGTSDGGG